MACGVGNQTKIKDLKTSTGTKDTYLEHFIEKLAGLYKNKKGAAAKKSALDAQSARMPTNVLSPVWRIKGA